MALFRRAAERAARYITLRRHLPTEFGGLSLWVSPDASLSWLKPGRACFDEELLAMADEFVKPGSTVWDIGANVGMFAFAAAGRAGPKGRVTCVEPDLDLARLLTRSARAARQSGFHVDVLVAALSNAPGVATFQIAARGRASNALDLAGGRSQMGGVREKRLVPTLTADLLIASCGKPDFVKIDVEGAEVMLLEGARSLLNDCRPIIYCEVGEQQLGAATSHFLNANYKLFRPSDPRGQRKPLEQCCFNTLAIPAERV